MVPAGNGGVGSALVLDLLNGGDGLGVGWSWFGMDEVSDGLARSRNALGRCPNIELDLG